MQALKPENTKAEGIKTDFFNNNASLLRATHDDSVLALDELMEDVETVLEENSILEYLRIPIDKVPTQYDTPNHNR